MMSVHAITGPAMAAGVALAAGGNAGPAAAQPCGEFTHVASPNSGDGANVLFGVAALSAGEAWAVGYARSGSMDLPLGMRWNGAAWTLSAMPVPPSAGNLPQVALRDVHAFSASDVWAVGSNPPPSSGAIETLVYRWDGQSWSIVPSPAPCCGSSGSAFYCVDGVSGDDFWAAGYMANPVAANAFAAHWNGSNWQEHNLPISTGSIQAIKDLHVKASDDIWALEGVNAGPPNAPRRIFHWDGSSWSEGAPPINAVLYFAAETIYAFGPDDIWVPSVLASGGQIVMLHYDGSAWAQMIAPVFAYEFFGDDPAGFFAVGGTSIMHWDGSAWTVAAAIPGQAMGNCFDAELAPDGTLWAAGNTQPRPGSQTLTARFTSCPAALPGDLDGDGGVDIADLLGLLAAWGPCPTPPAACPADVDGDGSAGIADLLLLLSNWS